MTQFRFRNKNRAMVGLFAVFALVISICVAGVSPLAQADSAAKLAQESASATTRVVIHYAPKGEADQSRGVYLWGTDQDGKDLAGKHYAFTGEDAFGKVLDLKVPGAYAPGKLGAIITTEQWNKDGGDRMLDASSGTAEVWIEAGSEETATRPPEQFAKIPKVLDVTVHYLRPAGDYEGWDLWTWVDDGQGSAVAFTGQDSFGKVATYQLKSESGIHTPKFIVRQGGDAWSAKDPGDGDRVIPQSAITMKDDSAASTEIWIMAKDAQVYTNPTVVPTKTGIIGAEISELSAITATVRGNVPATAFSKESVKVEGAEVTSVKFTEGKLRIEVAQPLDLSRAYQVKAGEYGGAVASAGSVVRTPEFDAAYAYEGELGAKYAPEQTELKLWAPTASEVKVNVYSNANPTAPLDSSVAMERGEKGVWSAVLPGERNLTAYDFSVSFANGTTNESPDPYAKAAVANGKRSVILSPESSASGAAGERMPAFGPATNASIAEMNVRDFSIDPHSGISPEKRGKFLGVVEEGTRTEKGAVSGLEYLKQLGVTHVQIMPMYDYGSVDETASLAYGAQQNWGYDPVNYNVPEGSYSSDPYDPAARVAEAKQMVAGLHGANLRVIMDVVYNHVYDAASHAFNQTVPGYFFRYNSEGSLVNNSGVGNDTASERAMMRKYVVDSVTYWASEYNLDGFRFDLMGLHDIETMRQVRTALNKIDPSIILLGEGWDMNTTLPKRDMMIQPNAYRVAPRLGDNGLAFFNDSIRDGLKGSVFNESDTGFVSGKPGLETLIANNLLACQNSEGLAPCTNGNDQTHYAGPGQIVNYVEIHDNLTLYDKLKASRPEDSEATRLARAKLATSAVYLAQGIPAQQMGQEFLRTKGGDENSYRSGDAVNAIDWDRTVEQADAVAYTRGLIELRKATPALRKPTNEAIFRTASVVQARDGVVAYRVTDGEDTYVVILNANEAPAKVADIAAGDYEVLVADGKVSAEKPARVSVGTEGYEASALSATVLRTAKAEQPGGDPSEEPSQEPQPNRGIFYADAWGQPAANRVINYGNPSDELLFGDWNGDGVSTPMVRRGNHFLGTNAFTGVARFEFCYGNAGDEVLVGDWDGDGVDTLAVVRGNRVLMRQSLSSGVADREISYGNPPDQLIAGNFDADAASELAAVRGNTVYLQADLSQTKAPTVLQYGTTGDRVVAGDWNGDGIDGIAVIRGNAFHLRNALETGVAQSVVYYGDSTDSSYVGDWNGDGVDTPAVDRR